MAALLLLYCSVVFVSLVQCVCVFSSSCKLYDLRKRNIQKVGSFSADGS